jgi:hypothetical protein
MGHHHFLYASRGPSLGQWLMAHGAGGRPVAGAVRFDSGDSIRGVHAGQVIELDVASTTDLAALVSKLRAKLDTLRLEAVSVGKLMRDAGQSA